MQNMWPVGSMVIHILWLGSAAVLQGATSSMLSNTSIYETAVIIVVFRPQASASLLSNTVITHSYIGTVNVISAALFLTPLLLLRLPY